MTVSIWKSTAKFKNKASIIRFVSFVNFVDKNIALPASRTTRYMAGQLTTFLTCGQVCSSLSQSRCLASITRWLAT